MGFSPDGQMILGEVPDRAGLYVMAGCSGHGMGLSFHAAKRLVENLFGAPLPEHLDLKRFTLQARKTLSK
jgi:gamma-glutamylputrescine oxidase